MLEPPARIGLVGLHGHGGWHLRNVAALAARQRAQLVGVCDLRPPDDSIRPQVGAAPWTDDLDRLLAWEPDIIILCTPIHTHVEMGQRVVRAGVHLLLEKPTAPSIGGFEELQADVDRAGVACQVGYQAMGSEVVQTIEELLERGEIGELVGVGGAGTAVRLPAYYQRSEWAGRRRLTTPRNNGGPPRVVDVVDGVLTNPFVHALAGALRIAGAEESGAILATEVELYRANPIEADDTSVIRMVIDGGRSVVVAGTTCAEKQYDPHLVVHGSRGRIVWPYKLDQIVIDRSGSDREVIGGGRVDLLDNLIDHLHREVPLAVPLAATRAVTEAVDAIRRAPDPAPIDHQHLHWSGEGEQRRPIVNDVGALVRQAADRLATFSELGVAWARSAAESSSRTDANGVATLRLGGSDGAVVADYQLAPTVPAELGPRPFLHPIRTAAGTVVSDERPADHRWHLGLGLAIQDIDGVNVWGGRTYVTDMGYLWLDDHGTVRHLTEPALPEPVLASDGSVDGQVLTHRLGWFDGRHRCLLVEDRTVEPVPVGADRWALRLRTELRNATGRTIQLGSPGSHGREGGGYGGFFWRLAPSVEPFLVRTAGAQSEEQAHGSQAPWLMMSGVASPADGDNSAEAPFTLLASPAGDGNDRWFVRARGYPGFGLALAWDKPLILGPSSVLRREFRVLILDGRWGSETVGEDGDLLHRQLHRALEESPATGFNQRSEDPPVAPAPQ